MPRPRLIAVPPARKIQGMANREPVDHDPRVVAGGAVDAGAADAVEALHETDFHA